MLTPDALVRIYRKVPNRRLKALGFQALRATGLRHLVIRMDTINLCNLRCKMCYYSFDYKRKKEQMELPLFRKIADQVFPKTRFLYLSCATEPLMNKQFADFYRERNYEYAWYGKFEVSRETFGIIKNEFENFDRKLS